MPSDIIQGAIKWIRGEDAVLYQKLPEDITKMHVNQLLGRHPFHPYSPDLEPTHPCAEMNRIFYECMASKPADQDLHVKHVACYHPFKTDLMKCLVREKRRQREAAEKQQSTGNTNGSA